MQKICDWGRYPVIDSDVVAFDQITQLQDHLFKSKDIIAYGNGRSYGDASLQKNILSTKRFNIFKSFDDSTGILWCESGVLLEEILKVFIPKGWFLPVTPGTKYITVGGAIASDIHGKNHHQDGSFGKYIHEIEVMKSDGSIIKCSPDNNTDFFNLTVGGMGLSGVILNAKISLQRIETSYIIQQTKRVNSLDELLDQFEYYDNWKYSVSWIDTYATGKNLGRGLFIRGRHAKISDLESLYQKDNPLKFISSFNLSIPFEMPNFFINNKSSRIFNNLFYYSKQNKTSASITSYEKFFYPLDKLKNWNKLYGKRGFTQYQLVLPKTTDRKIIKKILKIIQEKKQGSSLVVLKLFGDQNSFISFPMAGYTISFDFPINHGTFLLMNELDKLVIEFGGRLYLAKDVRMSEEMFFKTYPNAKEFTNSISSLNSGKTRFSSLLSERLGIT